MSLGIYTAAAFRNVVGVAQVAANAAVEVRNESDGALADIYSDRAGTTPISQPGFQANGDGYFEFYAVGQQDGYRVRVTSTGLDITLRYQRTGTAGEYDATPYGAQLMNAPDAATGRTTLDVYSTAQVDAGDAANSAETLTAVTGRINGLLLANNATDISNDIDIAPGVAVSGDGMTLIELASTLVKRIDAAWAVGTNQGGMDTGSVANDTWYYIWLIRRSDTGVVDALFSLSSTAPTMPANYDQKRLIGAVRRDTAANRAFYSVGDIIFWRTAVTLVNAGTATAETSITTTAAFPSVAQSARLTGELHFTYTNNQMIVRTMIRVATGVDFSNIAYCETQDGGSGFNEGAGGGDLEVPNTGSLYYLINQSGTTARDTTIKCIGFTFRR